MLFAVLLGALALSGCGARKTARAPLGSVSHASRTVSGVGIACNQFSAQGERLAGKVMAYVGPDGNIREDILRLRLTAVPDAFGTDAKFKLKFFRWRAFSDGKTEQDEANPIEFRLELPGHQPISDRIREINVVAVTDIMKRKFIQASTASEFFGQVDIILFDVDYSWDVLRPVVFEYPQGAESRAIASVDVLMPIFSADPNHYAIDHSPVLQSLHPFWNDRDAKAMDYADAASRWCF